MQTLRESGMTGQMLEFYQNGKLREVSHFLYGLPHGRFYTGAYFHNGAEVPGTRVWSN